MLACLAGENMKKGLGRSLQFSEVFAQHTCAATCYLWGGAAGEGGGGWGEISREVSAEGPAQGSAEGSARGSAVGSGKGPAEN